MPILYICDTCGKEKGNGGYYEEGHWEVIPTIGGSGKVLCPDCQEKDLLFLAKKRRNAKIRMAVEIFKNGVEQEITIAEVMEEIKRDLLARELLEKARENK